MTTISNKTNPPARGTREQPRAIAEETLNSWKINRQRGDVKDIQIYAGDAGRKLSRQVIMNALRGFCTATVEEVINDYYREKNLGNIIMLNSQPLSD